MMQLGQWYFDFLFEFLKISEPFLFLLFGKFFVLSLMFSYFSENKLMVLPHVFGGLFNFVLVSIYFVVPGFLKDLIEFLRIFDIF